MTCISLSEGEWKLMNELWKVQPCNLTTLVNALEPTTHWTKATVFVMLRRLIEKGAVKMDTVGKKNIYSAAVIKEDCSVHAAKSFLSRVYKGSLGMMVSSLSDYNEITKEDIDELRSILDEAEKNISEDK